MRIRNLSVVLLGVLAFGGCAKKKSTEDLLSDLKSSREKDRVVAVRLLPQRKGEAAQAVPALIAALKAKENDIRRSAAIGLGNLGESAKESIPALRAAQRDRDARVREAARVALSRIDPQQFPARVASRTKSG